MQLLPERIVKPQRIMGDRNNTYVQREHKSLSSRIISLQYSGGCSSFPLNGFLHVSFRSSLLTPFHGIPFSPRYPNAKVWRRNSTKNTATIGTSTYQRGSMSEISNRGVSLFEPSSTSSASTTFAECDNLLEAQSRATYWLARRSVR